MENTILHLMKMYLGTYCEFGKFYLRISPNLHFFLLLFENNKY